MCFGTVDGTDNQFVEIVHVIFKSWYTFREMAYKSDNGICEFTVIKVPVFILEGIYVWNSKQFRGVCKEFGLFMI